MHPASRQRLARAAWSVVGAAAGLASAIVVTLNVHIWVGLEQGYGATPSEVLDTSVMLGVVDVLLLVFLPVTGAVAVRRLRQRSRPDHDDRSPRRAKGGTVMKQGDGEDDADEQRGDARSVEDPLAGAEMVGHDGEVAETGTVSGASERQEVGRQHRVDAAEDCPTGPGSPGPAPGIACASVPRVLPTCPSDLQTTPSRLVAGRDGEE